MSTDTNGSGLGGVVTWNYSVAASAVEYLAKDETKVEQFTITLDDGNGGTIERTIEVTITGTNDAPDIAADAGVHNLPEGNAALSTSGTLAVSDVDVTNTVAAAVTTVSVGGSYTGILPVGLNAALLTMLSVDTGDVIDNATTAGTINWNFNSGAQAFDFLAANQTLELTYTIRATDSDTLHATDDQTVVITITGTDDAPVAAIDAISNATPPSGWVLNADNGHYYRYVAAHVTWAVATSTAASDGGYLATITSAAENAFIANLPGMTGTVWTSGQTTSANPNGATPDTAPYKWTAGPENGSLFTYTNWNPGEPDGGFGNIISNANLAAVQFSAASGTWDDVPTEEHTGGGYYRTAYVEEWGGQAGQVAFREDTGTTLTTAQLLANDTDVDSSSLTITGVSANSLHGGTVSLVGNIVTYHPAANYNGADSFTYTVSDGSLTSTGTVSFDVTAVYDAPPVISTASLDVSEDGLIATVSGLSVSDVDASPTEIFTIDVAAASGSSVTFVAGTDSGTLADINTTLDAGIIYDPGLTPPATDMVTLTIADASGASDTVNFIFNVVEPPASTPIMLSSTSEKDVLFGTGYQDQFVFTANSKHDTIIDFTAGTDDINLWALATVDSGNIGDFLATHMTTTIDGDTLIALDTNDTIIVRNVVNLTTNDFIVHAA